MGYVPPSPRLRWAGPPPLSGVAHKSVDGTPRFPAFAQGFGGRSRQQLVLRSFNEGGLPAILKIFQ
jgi:hypothetical protein